MEFSTISNFLKYNDLLLLALAAQVKRLLKPSFFCALVMRLPWSLPRSAALSLIVLLLLLMS